MNNFNDETCYCKECGSDYDVSNNNEYGYMNCCLSCGENKYEEYLEEKKKEINFNDLPCDIMTKIMNINKVSDRQEKLKQKAINFRRYRYVVVDSIKSRSEYMDMGVWGSYPSFARFMFDAYKQSDLEERKLFNQKHILKKN